MHTFATPSAPSHPLPNLPVHNACWRLHGVLVAHAEVRASLQGGDGAGILLLCFDVQLPNQFGSHLHVQKHFPNDQQTACHSECAALKKGASVTVDVPLVDLHLVAHNAAGLWHQPAPPKPAMQPARQAANQPTNPAQQTLMEAQCQD